MKLNKNNVYCISIKEKVNIILEDLDIKELNINAEDNYVTWNVGDTSSNGWEKSQLSKALPQYMIPSYFVRLESFPHTPNGKVDSKRLPDLSQVEIMREEFVEVGYGLFLRTKSQTLSELNRSKIKLMKQFLNVNKADRKILDSTLIELLKDKIVAKNILFVVKESIDKGKEKIKPHFVFKDSRPTGKVLFRCEDLVIGYDKPLSKPINLEILRGERVVIKGSNGIGKTTLVKSLIGDLKPISGSVTKSPAVDINYFEQEVPGNRNTPFEEIRDSFPTLNNGEIHYFLAASGLTNQNIESQIITLSGGEAARVRLCKLTIGEYNCLVLDEPTNHLDVLAKESLAEAIKNYKGTVLLVCHEADFYQDVASRIINLEDYSL